MSLRRSALHHLFTLRTHAALFLVVAGAAACSDGAASSPTAPAVGSTIPAPDDAGAPAPVADAGAASDDAATPSKTPAITRSALLATIQAAGLDPNALPLLDDVAKDHTKLHAVMSVFTKSLGVGCDGCHAAKDGGTGLDFQAETPNKKIAHKMWDDFVRGLAFQDGSPLFCDSCHQGKDTFLDRHDDRSLAAWMDANFVGGVRRRDGAAQTCASCHGAPFDPGFLDTWASN